MNAFNPVQFRAQFPALADAGVDYGQIEQGFVGYCSGDSTSGQRALYELGMTGIPIVNVNNNCSTGSTALFLGAQAIRGGLSDCVLALGFEKMQPGSLGGGADDRESPLGRHIKALAEIDEFGFPVAPWMFGAAGREYMRQYGATAEHFAKIGYKNHKHSVNNPYAQFQEEYSLEDIMAAKMISDPLTKLQCSPTSDGSGAAILRLAATGFPLPRPGEGCALWPLFEALAQPQLPVARLIETTGEGRFAAWAVAERLLPMGFDGPALSRAQMLIRPAALQDTRPALPVGPACRICPRPACTARHEPSILGPA